MLKPTLEREYWQAEFASLKKLRVPVLLFEPTSRELPERALQVESAWKGIESILGDIISRFDLNTDTCLEFGVEFGYSTAALSSFFKSVIGVDLFHGDRHTRNQQDIFSETSTRLSGFENIKLVRSDYRDWIKQDNSQYDLIHVDIVHTYADTFACGLWSTRHSRCTIFHDTESFLAVRRAVKDIARETGKTMYNFRESNGLGILV